MDPREHPTVRRLAPQRIGLLAAVAVVVLGLILWAVVRAGQGAIGWLHAHPDYQISFHEIVLDPPPPPSLLGGKDALLDRVRDASRFPWNLSVLDLDLAALRIAFKRDPWVLDVGRVRKTGPKGVVVSLRYRKPIARARFRREFGYAVDDQGVLLPADEIAPEPLDSLIVLQDFPRYADPHAGQEWNRLDPGNGLTEPDPEVGRAIRLAAFFREKLLLDPAASKMPRLYLLAPKGEEQGFWIQIGNDIFWWSNTDDRVKPGTLDEEGKWALIRDRVMSHEWVRQGFAPPRDKPRCFLLSHGGLVPFVPGTVPDRGDG